VDRNVARIKSGKEDEEYVRRRHRQSSALECFGRDVVMVDTSAPLQQTLSTIRAEVWRRL
jgi:ribose 1,5-bisphosphokinase PhnN